MKTIDECRGCRSYMHNGCKMLPVIGTNENPILCPCKNCLIKMMCKKHCRDLYDYCMHDTYNVDILNVRKRLR